MMYSWYSSNPLRILLMLLMIDTNSIKDKLESYSESEFKKILNEFYSDHRSSPSPKGDELENYLDNLLDMLTVLVGT